VCDSILIPERLGEDKFAAYKSSEKRRELTIYSLKREYIKHRFLTTYKDIDSAVRVKFPRHEICVVISENQNNITHRIIYRDDSMLQKDKEDGTAEQIRRYIFDILKKNDPLKTLYYSEYNPEIVAYKSLKNDEILKIQNDYDITIPWKAECDAKTKNKKRKIIVIITALLLLIAFLATWWIIYISKPRESPLQQNSELTLIYCSRIGQLWG
jgi:hypothetical protein